MKFKKDVDLVIQKMKSLFEEMKIEEKEINEIEERKVNDLLYDFDTFYFASSSSQVYVRRFSDVNGLQRLFEDVLSIAATEAICERYFRICSMITKIAYVTNLSERTVQRMSFLCNRNRILSS